MKETIEIRWHGRAGQGVVTAAATCDISGCALF